MTMFNFFKKIFKINKTNKTNVEKYDAGELTIEQWNSLFKTPADRLDMIFKNELFLNNCFKYHAHNCINKCTKITYEFKINIDFLANEYEISYADIGQYFSHMKMFTQFNNSFIFKGLYQSQSHLHSDYLVFEKIKE